MNLLHKGADLINHRGRHGPVQAIVRHDDAAIEVESDEMEMVVKVGDEPKTPGGRQYLQMRKRA
jgi:hypothetical protein